MEILKTFGAPFRTHHTKTKRNHFVSVNVPKKGKKLKNSWRAISSLQAARR